MKSWARRLAFGIGLALAQPAWAGNTFEAVLIGSNEVPEPGMGLGSFDAVVVVEGTKVTLTLSPRGASGWMSAHIHKGEAGVTGRLVAEFPWTSGDGSPRTAVGSVSEKDAASLAADPGKYYVDVHTTAFPAGAARGQLAARPNAEASATPAPAPVPAVGYDPRAVQAVGSPQGGVPLPAGMARPGPGIAGLVQPPFTSPYDIFFRLLGDMQPASRDHHARAAGLTDKEAAILTGVAVDFNRALALLDGRLQAVARPGSPSPEAAQLWEERRHLADQYVVQLRGRLGEAAFGDLDSYVGDHFPVAPGAPAPPPLLTPKRGQAIDFAEQRLRVYRDPDFRLDASASSGLRVFFTASGDCTVYGSTVHILSAGKCWVAAHQPGDSRFEAAEDVERRIVIEKAAQRIDGAAPAAKTYLDPDFPPGMSATSGLSVVFFAWGDCTAGRSYLHITGAGSCAFTAHQPGDSNYLAAQIVDAKFPINKADQKIEFEEFLNPYFGAYVVPLNARASSGLPVVYSVVFGPCEIADSLLRIVDSGECVVAADQPGDRNFNAARTVKRSIQVVLPPPRREK